MKKLHIALYCLLGGLTMTVAALGTGGFTWCWLAGILFSAGFVPVAMFGPKGMLSQFRVIFPVFMIVTVLCTWSEALIFVSAPEIQQHWVRNLISSAALYAVFTIVLAVLASVLKLNRDGDSAVDVRPLRHAALLVIVCGFAYAFYYLIFGAITYQFFTKQYYPTAVADVQKLGLWFWAIQIARGVVMTVAVIPVICTLRMSRFHAAIAVGLLIWIAGGAAPLLLPNVFMGQTQRFIHIVEIFTQNASLGFTAVMLLRRKSAHASEMPAAATIRA